MAFSARIKTAWVQVDPEDASNGFDVRAIGFPEVAQLIDANRDLIAPLFDRATGADKKRAIVDINELAREFLVSAPSVVTHLIALAADVDDPEHLAVLRRLPLDVQMVALEKIAHLTFASLGGAKNFLETAIRMMAEVSGLAEEAREIRHQISTSGSKDSAPTAAS